MSAADQPAALPCGCLRNLDINAYHASDAVGVSKLKVFRYSPALFYGRFIAKTIPPPDETKAFREGKAIESLALDGRAAHLAAYYAVPEGVGKVRVGDKAIREGLALAHPGKVALSHDEWEMVERINENVQDNPLAGPLLAACEKQVTFRIQGDTFYMQVRPDAWAEEGCALTDGEPTIVDLKSIPKLPDDDPDVIPRQISDFWYYGQAYTYREIVATVMKYPKEFRPRFIFVFVEKESPWRVKVVELDDVSLDIGFRQVTDTMTRLKQCYRDNHWPNSWDETFVKKVPKVTLPNYVIRRELKDEGNIF